MSRRARGAILFSGFSALLLASCALESPQPASGLKPTEEPAVAIAHIDGPFSGPLAGALSDAVDVRRTRSGALLVAADTQYDPVTGQTSSNPISVYVTASDSESVASVELFHNGVSMGSFVREGDAQAFGNPFIFPAPRSGLLSVPIPGAPSGLVASSLQAVARDASGQASESAVLGVQADGSRPDFAFSVQGNGQNGGGRVLLSGQAFDPESGIASFSAFLNGEPLELSPDAPTSFAVVEESLTPGPQSVRLIATNGVMVPNEAVYTFTVAEPPTDPEPPPEPPTDPDPPPPTDPDPPTDPVDPPTDPVEPPPDPVEPPTDPEPGAPTITSFVADPPNIARGETSTLSWDIEGTVTEVTISPEVGDVTTDDDNQVTVTPTETTTYTITATNEEGSDAETVRIVVADDNGGVNAVDDAAETVAGEPVVIEVLENDEPSDAALTIVRATAPVRGGEVRISRDSKTITYTSPADFSGTDRFRYTVRDGEGNTSTATVTIQVGTPD